MAVARKYEGKPIAFIAVNSGSSRGEVASYIKQKQVSWPTLVDSDRSFEKQCGVAEISLQNIYQLRVLGSDGTLSPGSPQQMEQAVERALQTAKWNVDPADMPANLKTAWQAVEFGNYAAAATQVKGGLKSNKPDVKAASEKLHEHVQNRLQQRFDAAQTAAAAGKAWEAYKTYSALLVEFRGYEIPPEAEKAAKEMGGDAMVKAEIAAMKRLEAARKLLGSSSVPSQKRAIKLLEQLAADAPATEAAELAKQLAAQAGAP